MKINKIVGEACIATRSLWEEVFYEDSLQFTDYYFKYKAEKNIGYVIGCKPYAAMMFRTPYRLQIGEEQRVISYIVGVATKKEHRYKGYMRALLTKSMEDMYQEKEPFAFLMPANPAIYDPFDFCYVYERDNWQLIKEPCIEEDVEPLDGLYAVSQLVQKLPQYPIYEKLAQFANRVLQVRYKIYVHRDISYYEMQLKESMAQNGDIFVFLEKGEVKAFYLYAKEEDEIFLQEVLEEQEGILGFLQKKQEKKPIIMARILHLEEMMKLVRSKIEQEVILQVEDNLIKENNGVFYWRIGPNGSSVKRLTNGTNVDYKVSISELTTQILKDVFINEIV